MDAYMPAILMALVGVIIAVGALLH